MLEIFADGVLVYDSRVPEAALLELKVTKALNKGGTATMTVPPGHRAYNAMNSFRTLVEIYRDGELVFRGRPLYPTNSFEMLRTFTCEGERCFLNDAVLRGRHLYRDEETKELTDEKWPDGRYLYQASPEEIFRDLVAEYNEQVDEFKQFEVGTVDVADANNYVRLENGEAESVAAVLDKLIERCGGYITFANAESGKRAINWRAALTGTAEQEITFGENLLDFTGTDANTELATVIVPYGAVVNENTGERLTIKDVNGGTDHIIASDAVLALRGYIWKAVTWDDVTDPSNLLTKARAYLAECSQMRTTLTLTALDLSVLDKNVQCFWLGDLIKVNSRPHGIDRDEEPYQLTEMTLDLLNPQNDTITLGKTVASLTGSDVVATMQASNALNKVHGTARAAYQLNTEAMVQLEQTFRSEIEQIPSKISLSVSGSLGGTASITMSVNGVQTPVGSLDLSDVRRAFANDTSAVTVSAGTITFNSGTLIVNSGNFQLTADGTITAKAGTIGGWTLMHHKLYAGDGVDVKTVAIQAPQESTLYVFAAGGTSHDSYADCPFRVTKHGKLYATDAVIHGDVITIDGSFKTQLDRGSLKLYYSDALCGTINTKYWSGASTEGISLRIENAGSYIMFSHPDSSQGTGYAVDYYLNYGWSSNYDEKHIFQTSARFLADVYMGRVHITSLRLVNGDGEYLIGVNSNGALTCSKL